MAPEEASVRQADGSWATSPSRASPWRSAARQSRGARADGRVVSLGQTSINQAPVTGESIPVDKAPGDPVFAGTDQRVGDFRVRGDRTGLEFDARAHHPRRRGGAGDARADAGFVDRFAARLHAGGLRHRAGRGAARPLAARLDWLQAIYKALVLLVIACPARW